MSARQHITAWAAASLALSGCSILSPMPMWELAKATGGLAAKAIQSDPGEASNTVHHPHASFSELCIEFNPQTQTADVVPALQTALRSHQIESRVYEGEAAGTQCRVWLRYSTLMEWDKPSLSDRYQSYVSSAALTLQSSQGRVLSSSYYTVDPAFGSSKWASTYDKLAPVVAALVTGVVPAKGAPPMAREKGKDAS
jgi:hypothetical protein